MSRETETLALHLVSALYEASDGSVQQWRVLAEMDGMTAEAIVFAADELAAGRCGRQGP